MSDLFPYGQLPISTVPDLSDQIERTNELIGRGGYGSVYKGRWLGASANTSPAVVAIKIIEIVMPRDEAQRTKRFKQITRELSLWCSIQHENILPLSGIAHINGYTNIPAFVSPWMENGNAKEFCSRNPHFPPTLILYDIINGLHYLHTLKPEIVHGDIKAVNVLINSNFKACLCDFGLSRFLIDNALWKTAATHAGGTVRWMAPELISGDASTPTKGSDIYAYGMTCYEILSGDVPFKSVSNDMAIPLKVMKGQRPNRTESFYSDSMWDIVTRCWEQEPEARIPTEKVLGLLREKKEVEEALAKIGEKDVALAEVEKEMAVLKAQIADLLATNQRQHEEIRQMKTARGTSTDSKQIDTLLSPTIVNKADSIFVEEAANLVRMLNAQIEQIGTLLVGALSYQESPRTGKQRKIEWDELHDYIGSWLCKDLKRNPKELDVEPDPLITQITLQTGLVNACSCIISDRNPPFWINGLQSSRTYSRIANTSDQATADAWRALSQTNMNVSQSERQANKRYLTEVLLQLIIAIGGSLESAGILPSECNAKVEEIVQKAVVLHKTVNEDITSMELATFTNPYDTPFDASHMEDGRR